jgi:tellurite resistance protein TerC
MPQTVGSPLVWAGFLVLVVAMLALDLGVLHRKPRPVGPREALAWSLVWLGVALAFNAGVAWWSGPRQGLEFLTGYLLEKALSVDNLFVFVVLFSYFSVPAAIQHRVLFWGVLGAIVLRAIFIMAGAALLHRFEWIVLVFGGFLLYTGGRLLLERVETIHPERNPLLRLARRFFPVVAEYEGGRFFVVRNGRRHATPLLLVLTAVEGTDLLFAVDSIPAVFAVTRDPFIVFTSNVFAILGLRSLYFLLAGVIDRFRYLKVGLGLVLMFVGAKMLVGPWYQVPTGVSLAIIGALLAGFLLASLARPPVRLPERRWPPDPEPGPAPGREPIDPPAAAEPTPVSGPAE